MQDIKLTGRFAEAVDYAAKLHSKHLRKGTTIPYMSHLLAVASIVMENGDSEDEVIAALLHDAAEDCGGKPTLDVIEQKFGKTVSEIVSHCTDSFEEDKEDWEPRKKRYMIKLSKVTNPSVHLVSISDKLHNARSILSDYRQVGDKLWCRFNANNEGVLCYYNELIKIYRKTADKRFTHLIDELERTIRELEAIIYPW